MIIYKTTNIVNGKSYIGKYAGKNRKYLGSGVALRNAFKKYGKQNFVREVLEECKTLDELAEREKYWISKYNAVNSTQYYNMMEGGDGGFSHIVLDYDMVTNKRYGKKLTPPQGAVTKTYIQEYRVVVDGEEHIIAGMNKVAKFLNLVKTQVYKYLNTDGPQQGYKYNSLQVDYYTKIYYLIEGKRYETVEDILKEYPELKKGTLSHRLIHSDRFDWWKIVEKV